MMMPNQSLPVMILTRFCSSCAAYVCCVLFVCVCVRRRQANVCSDEVCREKALLQCPLTHAQCKHPCGGVRGEKTCLPCLHCCTDLKCGSGVA